MVKIDHVHTYNLGLLTIQLGPAVLAEVNYCCAPEFICAVKEVPQCSSGHRKRKREEDATSKKIAGKS